MAKKEQEMYEGMPVIEASDKKSLEKKLSGMAERPDKYVVRISNRTKLIKERAFWGCNGIAVVIISDAVTEIEDQAFEMCKGLKTVIFGKGL